MAAQRADDLALNCDLKMLVDKHGLSAVCDNLLSLSHSNPSDFFTFNVLYTLSKQAPYNGLALVIMEKTDKAAKPTLTRCFALAPNECHMLQSCAPYLVNPDFHSLWGLCADDTPDIVKDMEEKLAAYQACRQRLGGKFEQLPWYAKAKKHQLTALLKRLDDKIGVLQTLYQQLCDHWASLRDPCGQQQGIQTQFNTQLAEGPNTHCDPD